jgi:hypothetical protein
MISIDALRLERRRKKTVKARKAVDRHTYFCGVAEARFVLRKVFRLVEEEARNAGIDPLAHQALIQIYGSPDSRLRIRELAQRLDIAPSFPSDLVKLLVERGLVERRRDRVRPADRAMARVTLYPGPSASGADGAYSSRGRDSSTLCGRILYAASRTRAQFVTTHHFVITWSIRG